jgi:hypothetical protein
MPSLQDQWDHTEVLWERLLLAMSVVDSVNHLARIHVGGSDYGARSQAYLYGHPVQSLNGLVWARGRVHHRHIEPLLMSAILNWEEHDDGSLTASVSGFHSFVWPDRETLEPNFVADPRPTAEVKAQEKNARAFEAALAGSGIANAFRMSQMLLHHLLRFEYFEFIGANVNGVQHKAR